LAEAEAGYEKYLAECKCGAPPVSEADDNDTKRVGLVNVNRLAAKIALAKGNNDLALEYLRKALSFEDRIAYGEPPAIFEPVRINLGGLLLRMGRFAEAERTFRDDLQRNRGNGRSLFGLMKALEAQNKSKEAQKVQREFREAWKHADSELTVAEL
jgi:tetratricopeptide (TPR) repeat protein